MSNFWKKNSRDCLAFGVLLGALLLRISWFGMEYGMQLDDYIHYRDYPAGTDFIQLCIDRGLFVSRPLAAISDFLVWKPMPLFLTSAVLCAMYAGAGVLFWRLLRKYFGTGTVFLVVFALLPTGFEGTYWHAAATRILPPMLFAALAVTALDRFCEEKKWWHLAAYLLWGLLSFCFYEQMLVLSLTLCLMVTMLQLLQKRWHGAWGLLIFLPLLLYVLVTGYFGELREGLLKNRMNLMLPTDEAYFTSFLPTLLGQLKSCFLEGSTAILGDGLVRSLELIAQKQIWPVMGVGFVLAGVLCLDCRDVGGSWRALAPVFGILAALAPLTPFFVLANPWFGLRNMVPSFLGIALVVDWLARLVLRHRAVVLAGVLAAVCMIASVGELYDYRTVADHNERVAQTILAADGDWTGSVGILNLNQSYHPEQNFCYHDHVASAHVSDWGLEGLLRYYDGGAELSYKPVPLSADEEYYWNAWTKSTRDVTAYDALYLYDHAEGTLVPLTVTLGEGEWQLWFADGTLCARIWEDDQGLGHLEFS